MEKLFGLDLQFVFDAVVLALSMFVLFLFLSYKFFEPVRTMLEKRRQRVVDDQVTAKNEKEEAIAYKEEYEAKLKAVEKEAEEILSNARKTGQKNEAAIIALANEEAVRIKERAHGEIELEKKRALDDMKQEVIAIAALMAEKVVATSIDTTIHDNLIEETLKEMGEGTWVN
ncbi:MAG: F0F1 ATP synthase subunit B [Eubacteriales bacterium]